MLHEPAPGLHQPLLETRERPAFDPRRQDQSAPEVAQVVGQDAQLPAHLVCPEPMARQPRPVGGLLAFLDPLLRRAALVVEPDDRAARKDPVGHNEPDAREQLTPVVLHLGDNPSGGGPALRLVAETLVPHQRLAAWPSRRTKEDVFDRQLQRLVRRHANGIVHVALLERLVDRRPGERRVRPERHAPPRSLLSVNLRHEEVVPVVGARHVAGPQRGGQAVALVVEQKQRVGADGFKVPVLRAPFLCPMHRALA